PAEPAHLADLGPAPRERQLRLAERDADAVGLVLGRVAEQLVHLRPEALLLEAEGAVHVGGAAPVAAGGLPTDDPLLEHEHVDPGAGQPPAGAEPRDAPAHDHDRRAVRPGHVRHHRPIARGWTSAVWSRKSSSPGMWQAMRWSPNSCTGGGVSSQTEPTRRGQRVANGQPRGISSARGTRPSRRMRATAWAGAGTGTAERCASVEGW